MASTNTSHTFFLDFPRLTFSEVSPSHGSPSPNIRNISHLQDLQHILLHDVEVHDSRQWYPENMGSMCGPRVHGRVYPFTPMWWKQGNGFPHGTPPKLPEVFDELPLKKATQMEHPPFCSRDSCWNTKKWYFLLIYWFIKGWPNTNIWKMRSNHWIIGDDEISAEEGSWTLDPWHLWPKGLSSFRENGDRPEVFPHFQRYTKLF